MFSGVILLMEVPTGWLSDIWTRRAVMIAGSLANVIGWAMLWQAHGFFMASAAQGVIGIGTSLLSGTNSALLYESLLDLGEEASFQKREGLRIGVGLYACGITALLGGPLYAHDIHVPVLWTAVTSGVAILLALFMREPTRHRQTEHRHPLADMAATMRYAFRGHKQIAVMIGLSALLFTMTKVMFWTQQPYFIRIGVPVTMFGFFTAAGALLGGAGGHLGHRFTGTLKAETMFVAGFLVTFAVCAIAGAVPSLPAAILLVIGSFVWATINPRVQEILSRLAPPARRATVLSTASFAVHVLSMPMLIIGGWLVAGPGVRAELGVLAGLLALGGVLAGLAARRGRG